MTEKAKLPGLIVVNTGNGKGKTSSALGMLLRCYGHGMKVAMLQFIKSKEHQYGEHRAAEKLGVEIIPLGAGFTWLSKDIEIDKALARDCWALCKQKIMSGEYDCIILDELTYTITYGWLPVQEIIDVLKNRPPELHIIITGRDAAPELIDIADTVTEMREIKHAYKKGIKPRKGIDL
jgi:cob(I)alamin adenosyltransferase